MKTNHKKSKILLSLFLVVSMLASMPFVSANDTGIEISSNENGTEFTAPDIIDHDELDLNHYCGRAKEDEEDLYTFVFNNEDGSNTMRVFSHPVKYINEEGETKDISLRIERRINETFQAADHFCQRDLWGGFIRRNRNCT